MTVFMFVTDDEYELPLAVEDTAVALSKRLHLNPHSVSAMISRYKKLGYKCRFKKVEIDDDNKSVVLKMRTTEKESGGANASCR